MDALAAIVVRSPELEPDVKAALIAAYPVPPPPGDESRNRACRNLAERIHRALVDLTGNPVAFPETYDAPARKTLQNAW